MDTLAPHAARHRAWRIIAGLALAGFAVAAAVNAPAVSFAGTTVSVFSPSTRPQIEADPERRTVQLGMRFVSSVAGTVTSIRYYRSAENRGPHYGGLWSTDGKLLAMTQFSSETESGWQSATLSKPVKIKPGHEYIASYLAVFGRYSADNHGFDKPIRSGPLTALEGLYRYGFGGMPRHNYENSNYFVDVEFVPSAVTTPSPTTTPKPTATPKPGDPTVSATVRPVDGGADYYGGFTNGLPSTADYFPLGVWFESVTSEGDVSLDRAAGINTYVELTANSDLGIVRAAGSYAVTTLSSALNNGSLIADEADMWAGPGSGTWTGNYPGHGDVCSPSDSPCGYTVIKTLIDANPAGVMTYANYGKGVTFWQSDAEARPFVNATDVVSADNYWFTDPNICGATEGGWGPGTGVPLSDAQCRSAANYGWTVGHLRRLVQPTGSRPVWNFVEVGHPAGEDWTPTITAPQIRAAVWSGIIHGARGVIYFNHNFGGPCQSQHVLREQCGATVRPTVSSVNAQISELAPVLNAPFIDGLVTASGHVDSAVKLYEGVFYVIAGSTSDNPQQVTFSSECTGGTTANVLGESRTVPISGGRFSDTFADGNAVHIYRIDGGTSCGLG
ncbi:DUF4082 domain-containing protein [Rathayibacter sp. YIM 133350]|uniref:DUF4082 domain-containing protein n=1 Tax=Rathayibacter sp. YIM 133350 TaxID=3131992 RepID=UPI00307DE1E2